MASGGILAGNHMRPFTLLVPSMLTYFITLIAFISLVNGHGRLTEPPSRSSAWRFGFKTPANYNDNQLFCGGFANQWQRNGGKCGICGDPWQGPRDHEAGGKYATGTIVRTYSPGQTIDIKVELTASHLGYFEFRLCPNNNVHMAATQTCLDRHILQLTSGGTRHKITDYRRQMVNIKAVLPPGLECTQCVLQWKYNTGNSWGTDPATGRGCLGCGAQEQFYGCADVAVGSGYRPTGVPQTPRPTTAGPCPETTTTLRPIGGVCKAIGPWTGNAGMDNWCNMNCPAGNCPSTHCFCS